MNIIKCIIDVMFSQYNMKAQARIIGVATDIQPEARNRETYLYEISGEERGKRMIKEITFQLTFETKSGKGGNKFYSIRNSFVCRWAIGKTKTIFKETRSFQIT